MKYRMLQNCFIRLSLFRYFLMQCSIISFMCTLIRVYQCVQTVLGGTRTNGDAAPIPPPQFPALLGLSGVLYHEVQTGSAASQPRRARAFRQAPSPSCVNFSRYLRIISSVMPICLIRISAQPMPLGSTRYLFSTRIPAHNSPPGPWGRRLGSVSRSVSPSVRHKRAEPRPVVVRISYFSAQCIKISRNIPHLMRFRVSI